MPFDSSQLSNSMKYVLNDFLTTRADRKLVIEAEYCQGVRFALHRGADPAAYTVLNCDPRVIDNARALGADGRAGWTRDVLPTLSASAYGTVYMDYCCTPSGNDNCRPEEEMDDVFRVLEDGGLAMFTFAKRGVANAVRVATDMLQRHKFIVTRVHEYRLARSQAMFVVFCTKNGAWSSADAHEQLHARYAKSMHTFEDLLARHKTYDTHEVSAREHVFQRMSHPTLVQETTMTYCDGTGSWFPEGGPFYRQGSLAMNARTYLLCKTPCLYKVGDRLSVKCGRRRYKATVSSADGYNLRATYDDGATETLDGASDRVRREDAHVVRVQNKCLGLRIKAEPAGFRVVGVNDGPNKQSFRVGDLILAINDISIVGMDAPTLHMIIETFDRPLRVMAVPRAKITAANAQQARASARKAVAHAQQAAANAEKAAPSAKKATPSAKTAASSAKKATPSAKTAASSARRTSAILKRARAILEKIRANAKKADEDADKAGANLNTAIEILDKARANVKKAAAHGCPRRIQKADREHDKALANMNKAVRALSDAISNAATAQTDAEEVSAITAGIESAAAKSKDPNRVAGAKRAWETMRRQNIVDDWICDTLRNNRPLDFDAYRKILRDFTTTEKQWKAAVARVRALMANADAPVTGVRRAKRIRRSLH